jgi:hypothetical protein
MLEETKQRNWQLTLPKKVVCTLDDRPANGCHHNTEKLKTYALTYAKGQTAANGIVLLYGAGQIWPHVLGDFRLAAPAAVFTKYLAPQWKDVFTAG